MKKEESRFTQYYPRCSSPYSFLFSSTSLEIYISSPEEVRVPVLLSTLLYVYMYTLWAGNTSCFFTTANCLFIPLSFLNSRSSWCKVRVCDLFRFLCHCLIYFCILFVWKKKKRIKDPNPLAILPLADGENQPSSNAKRPCITSSYAHTPSEKRQSSIYAPDYASLADNRKYARRLFVHSFLEDEKQTFYS